MPITRFDRNVPIEPLLQALRRDGAAIVTELADSDLVDQVRVELRPQFDADGLRTVSDFNGSRTLRCASSLLVRAPSAAALIDHDRVVTVADEILVA